MPYFLIVDNAFSLRTWLMKPFSSCGLPGNQEIFNYRLSRAHRVVENVFGIIANRLGCLLTTMNTMHNIMRTWYPGLHHGILDDEDEYYRLVSGQWRQGVNLKDMEEVTAGNKDTQIAKKQTYLKHYYNSFVGLLCEFMGQ